MMHQDACSLWYARSMTTDVRNRASRPRSIYYASRQGKERYVTAVSWVGVSWCVAVRCGALRCGAMWCNADGRVVTFGMDPPLLEWTTSRSHVAASDPPTPNQPKPSPLHAVHPLSLCSVGGGVWPIGCDVSPWPPDPVYQQSTGLSKAPHWGGLRNLIR